MSVKAYFLPHSLDEAVGLLAEHGPSLLVMAGGTIATVATGWFAVKVFAARRNPGPENGAVTVRQFYWGELNKVVLTAALFVIAFVYIRPVSAAALLGTYFIVHITPSLYEMIVGRSRDVNTRNNNE